MVKIEDTKQLIDALRNKYDDNGFSYAFLEQVSDGTGYKCNRWADALAVQLWESRGLEIIGFEVKVSRQDWLKELKQPDKADAIAKYCHQWYLVLGDESILHFGELPANWGLMIPHTKKSLKISKPAIRNKNPKPVDMPFLCAVLRRTTQQLTNRAIKQESYNKGHSDGFKDGKKEMQRLRDSKNAQLETLEKKIRDFEDKSGVKINDYWFTAGKIGDAVKLVLNNKHNKELENLENLKNRILDIVNNIDNELKKHKEKILN